MAGEKDMSLEEQVALLKTENAELKTRADAAEADAKAQKGRADGAEQKLDVAVKSQKDTESMRLDAAKELAGEEMRKLRERCDNAERDLNSLRDALPTAVAKRAELVLRARAVTGLTGSDFRADASDRVIHEAIIKALEPTFRTDGLSDIQVSARAEALYDARVRTAESTTRAGEVLLSRAPQQMRTDSKEARAKAWREQALNGGYKAGLPGQKEA